MAFLPRSQFRPRTNLFNRFLSFVESLHPSDRIVMKLSLILFAVTFGMYLFGASERYLVDVPHRGGTLTEGVVGTPRFINPLLAVTNADRDMTELIYAGILRLGPSGELVPDMAESVTASEDGLTYNVILKDNITFHDGVKVTADDIIFTVSRAQDPALKSPLLASWEGITVERVSDTELNFILPRPYAPFIENLTLGILPQHIWETADIEAFPFSQYNSEPIGSGPYKIANIIRSRSGIPESYELEPHTDNLRIERLNLNFYQNEGALLDAMAEGLVDSTAGLSPEGLERVRAAGDAYTLYTVPLPRTFAVFFNQNEMPIFRDASVRKALGLLTDRSAIVDEALSGYGYPVDNPLPPGYGNTLATTTASPALVEDAKTTLRNGGWKLSEETGRWTKKTDDGNLELAFSIATANNEVFGRTADLLKQQWEQAGIVVDVKKFEQSDLTQSVIRPRKFDALLFGTVVGRDLDFYSFWHSSQRNDPGLNVALYANITTDSLLTEARTTTSKEERQQLHVRFTEEIKNDAPAIFLYAPSFTYVVPNTVQNVTLTNIAEPYERFSSIANWFVETESVWPAFARNINQ